MYHRITTPSADPWELAVTPENFAAQLEVLRHFGAVRPLCELAPEETGAPHRQIAITFDDGYLDNLDAGLPILQAAGMPATMFISAGYTGSENRFWWDTLVQIFLETDQLPERMDIRLGSTRRVFKIGKSPSPARRQKMILTIWKDLVELDAQAIQDGVQRIADWAGVSRKATPQDRAMTLAEVQRLAGSGQIEIGGHTLSHPALTLVPPETAAREIAEGRAALRDWTGQPVESFAYPYGMHDDATASFVRDAGFKRSCTVLPGIATSATDPFRIPRLHVKNWPADEFEKQISSYVGR
ncbi:MAG: polysaccharide deacetylase family protein [Roseivivax sp.]|nr:polysaccharide deacetylase family protein [Roseivivax sp.]